MTTDEKRREAGRKRFASVAAKYGARTAWWLDSRWHCRTTSGLCASNRSRSKKVLREGILMSADTLLSIAKSLGIDLLHMTQDDLVLLEKALDTLSVYYPIIWAL
jgi:hypothetical protein